jgi:energy-coupling factor transporter ATP-binding protein EcfA2
MSGEGSYNVFGELARWSKSLERWQQAALLTIVTKKEVSESDFEVVYREFSVDRGLAIAPEKRDEYSFEASDIPHSGSSDKQVKLNAIQNVSGVNALAEKQVLEIGDNLTVIYGPNGAGKSGYARLLKSACFTRSRERDIHGNIRLPKDKRPSPSAQFVLDGGSIYEYKDGQPCQTLVENFAVFDSSCIRVYTDEKNDFHVSPYGFDVFPELVLLVEKTREILRRDIEKRTPDVSTFQIHGSNSRVAQILTTITDKSDLTELKALAAYEEQEKKQLEAAQKRLQELIQQDPQSLIKQKERQLIDIRTLPKKLEAIGEQLGKVAIDAINKEVTELATLSELAKVNSIAQFGAEPVQPVGTPAWNALIEAAIQYSEEAYPSTGFPPSAQGSRCVLCQQSLDNEYARDRLARFHAFVTSDTEKKIKLAIGRLGATAKAIQNLDIKFIADESSFSRSLADLDKDLLETVKVIVKTAEQVAAALCAAIKDRQPAAAHPFSIDVLERLSTLDKSLGVQIEELKKKDVSELKTKLTAEIQLLIDREQLSTIRDNVVVAVENLRWCTKATDELKKLNTKGITDKQKALTKELVAKGFVESFKKECEFLNFKLPIDVKVSGAAGTTQRNFEFSATAGTAPSPSKVLSEGEQTAVALADFLTEVRLYKRPLGVIFDDPVTSLDHNRKERIAHRLAREAKERQVIVFTHDIVFTSHLAQAAESEKVKFAGRTVSLGYDDGVPGYVGHAVFPHSYYEGKGIDDAEAMVIQARKLTGKAAMEKLQLGCGTLRTAYEDFIQRHIFNDAINRWREELKPFALTNMYYDEELIGQISEQMGRLSRHIEAHSHSAEYTAEPLTPDLLQEFTVQYRTITKEFNSRKQAFQKQKGRDKKIYE